MVCQDIEENGLDMNRVNNYAHNINMQINVEPITVENGSMYRVSVSFEHVFAIIKLDKTLTYTTTTRIFDS